MYRLFGVFLYCVASAAFGQSISFQQGMADYEIQQAIPPGFGEGEFTFEASVLLDNSLPVGACSSGEQQRTNWCNNDPQPFSNVSWWFRGNFLLDGHNNYSFGNGTFSLQLYGGGRLRWLFGDGQLRAVQAWPADNTASLLDGHWHKLTLVRRYTGSEASLEMYLDGALIDSSPAAQVDMRAWWNSWSGFPNGQEGWFWGVEKQAAIGSLTQYEDYKGLVDDRKFYSRAKSASEIANEYQGLVGVMRQSEASGSQTCDSITSICSALTSVTWSVSNAPERYDVPETPPPPASYACSNGIDDDGDGAIDLADPGCVDANDDDEADNGSPPPTGQVYTATFDQEISSYPWLGMSEWSRDTNAYAGNPGPTVYPRNYSLFPQETASFTFASPQVLQSLDIATKSSGNITISTNYESVVLPTAAYQPATLETGFTIPSTVVTISYVSGNFGIDNIVSIQ